MAAHSHAPPHRKREPFSANKLAVGAAVATAGWNAAALITRTPELAQAGATLALGALGTWQLIKSQIEDRRKK